MRGSDVRSGELFSYVDLEKRVPAKHPLRLVRVVVNEVLSRLDGDFAKAYAIGGRPSNAPERLLRALLLWPEGEFRTAAGESLAIPIPRRAALARLSRSKNLTYYWPVFSLASPPNSRPRMTSTM